MGHPAPALGAKTLGNHHWLLAAQTPENYTMIMFYRGRHCPLCEQHIARLDEKLEAFQNLGVQVIAISGDSLEQARQFHEAAKLQKVNIGYDLTLDDMRRWGLYLSKGHFDFEPTLFSEPALFLFKPDNRLYFSNLRTHPFSGVDLDVLLQGLEYIIPNNYPFRGTESI